ncbi:MAG TPA: zinc ribbon domain-containing protein [Clostridiaceae bacterium]|nr:zinc ribbon domain-containing protein [Clostridiaceae bacterium]
MENMVICSRCNNSIDGTKKFCKYCGQPVQQELNQSQNQYHEQSQSYDQSRSYPQIHDATGTKNYSESQPHQQKYGYPEQANYYKQQYMSQYPAQQPDNSAMIGYQGKKKTNKKVIGIASAVAIFVLLAVVLFVFVLPGRSPQKTAKQLEKAVLNGDEMLARDCFDAASLYRMGSVLSYMDLDIKDLVTMVPGLDIKKYLQVDFDILQVYDAGLPKEQCVVVLSVSASLINIPPELQFFVDPANSSFMETDVIAMIKEGSKWKFSLPLTEQLSDYIDRLNIPY